MATLDAARASYVQSDYRYETLTDNAVKAINSNAIEFEKPTNLSQAFAATMAAATFAIVQVRSNVYKIVWEALIYPEDFDGGAPMFRLYDTRLGLNGLLTRLESCEVFPLLNKTELTVSG